SADLVQISEAKKSSPGTEGPCQASIARMTSDYLPYETFRPKTVLPFSMNTFCMPTLTPQPLRCVMPRPAPIMKRVPLSEAPLALRTHQPKPGVTNGAHVMSPFFSTSAKGAPALNERAVMLLSVPV